MALLGVRGSERSEIECFAIRVDYVVPALYLSLYSFIRVLTDPPFLFSIGFFNSFL